MDVSIIVPCYNSERFILPRVQDIDGVMSKTRWSWEILLCDDGSRDRSAAVCEQAVRESPGTRRYLPSDRNRGRGKNVSDGIAQSQGRIVGFLDADQSTAASYLFPVLRAIEDGADVAEANRTYKLRWAEFPFIAHRYIAHIVYARLVRYRLGLRGHDTETGFKFFRRDAALSLLEQAKSAGWFWDTEMIANAHAAGYNVVEVPSLFVRIKGMGSTVKLFRDSWLQFQALSVYSRRFPQSLCRGCCERPGFQG